MTTIENYLDKCTPSGNIEFKGTVEGEAICRTLLIDETAKVDVKATAEKVVVRGAVDGQITASM